MAVQYKITVKPFINKHLSPLQEHGVYKFPLYYQVTYRRNNTQIKSKYNLYLENLTELSKSILSLIDFEIKHIQMSITKEIEVQKDDFSLHNINHKYKLYSQDLHHVFEQYLKRRLLKVVKYTNTEFISILRFDGVDVDFFLLLKALKLLNENFNKSLPHDFKEEIEAYQKFRTVCPKKDFELNHDTVLSWMNDNLKSEIRRKMIAKFEESEMKIEKTITILNSIIEETLKFS